MVRLGGIATQYDELLTLSTELGYELMISGAEIYRAEDSVSRLLRAYGATTGEVFAIPNCLIVSLVDQSGEPLTRIRRIPPHGTDIDRLERCNDLCRTLCRETPDCAAALEQLAGIRRSWKGYTPAMAMVGYFTGAFGFCLFFSGTLLDAVFSGLCSLAVGLCLHMMGKMGSNSFFQTIAASAVLAVASVSLAKISPALNVDRIAIGGLMALVPGVCFTSALRDIMAGDMLSGLSKAAEGILIGGAVAIGMGAGMAITAMLWGG